MRSERFRLASIVGGASRLSPESVFDRLSGLGAYSRVTYWVRITDFYEWLIEHGHRKGPNPFREFRRKNKRLFKNAYEPKIPERNYEEVVRLVKGIAKPDVREACLELLEGALRHVDYARRQGERTRGKGDKPRRVYGEQRGQARLDYKTIYKALRGVGLKPHELRKLRLNHLVDKGMDPYMLQEFAGWSDIKTAISYVKARDGKVESFLAEVDGGGSVVAQK